MLICLISSQSGMFCGRLCVEMEIVPRQTSMIGKIQLPNQTLPVNSDLKIYIGVTVIFNLQIMIEGLCIQLKHCCFEIIAVNK